MQMAGEPRLSRGPSNSTQHQTIPSPAPCLGFSKPSVCISKEFPGDAKLLVWEAAFATHCLLGAAVSQPLRNPARNPAFVNKVLLSCGLFLLLFSCCDSRKEYQRTKASALCRKSLPSWSTEGHPDTRTVMGTSVPSRDSCYFLWISENGRHGVV